MKKILIIEDEDDLRELIKSHLESQEYEVVTANDGVIGFVKAQKERPDLIVLDIMMPNIDGRTFLTQITESDVIREIPIIIITALEEYADSPVADKVDAVFLKPFDLEAFTRKIKKILSTEN